MKKIFKSAILALGLLGATMAITGTASAGNLGISLNLGNVAFAYQDGYWDHGHRWHRWQNRNEARHYRAQHRSHYHAWNHDRDRDRGWHRREDNRHKYNKHDKHDRHDRH